MYPHNNQPIILNERQSISEKLLLILSMEQGDTLVLPPMSVPEMQACLRCLPPDCYFLPSNDMDPSTLIECMRVFPKQRIFVMPSNMRDLAFNIHSICEYLPENSILTMEANTTLAYAVFYAKNFPLGKIFSIHHRMKETTALDTIRNLRANSRFMINPNTPEEIAIKYMAALPRICNPYTEV